MGCGIDEIGVAKETCVKPHGRSVESGDEDLWMGIKGPVHLDLVGEEALKDLSSSIVARTTPWSVG